MDISNWFKSNMFSLHCSLTHCLEFRTRNFIDDINVCYNNHCIFNTTHTKRSLLFWNKSF